MRFKMHKMLCIFFLLFICAAMDQEELADKDEIILYDSDEKQAEIIENSEPQPQPELPQPAPDLQHVPDD